MRQTDYPFKQLAEYLDTGKGNLRPCLLANEIGEIAVSNTVEGVAARLYLSTMLLSEDEGVRFAAYGFGMMVPEPSEELSSALESFTANPDNAGIVSEIANRLK